MSTQPGDTGNYVTRAQGRKKSNFPAQTLVLENATFDYFVNGVNYKIAFTDLLPALGATGTLTQLGQAGSVPILDPQGSDNRIRNARGTVGIETSVNATEELEIKTALQTGDISGVQVLINETTTPAFRSIKAGQGIAVSGAGDVIQISSTDTPVSSSTIVVNSLSDFPTPVAGVITLADNTTYLIASDVDVSPNRFIGGNGSAVTGSSLFATSIISDTTGPLFAVSGSGPQFEISNITLNCPNAAIIDYTSTTANLGGVLLSRMQNISAASVGTVTNARVVFISESIFDSLSGGLSLAGTSTILNIDSVLASISAGTLVDLGTSTFSSINIENANIFPSDPSVVIVDGQPNSGNLNVGAQGIVRAVSIVGSFTSTGNILPSDSRWFFYTNPSLQNSVNSGEVSMFNNATVTTITATNTPVKVAGTWAIDRESRFTADTTGRLTYTGETPSITVSVSASVSTEKQGGGTDSHIFYIAKNGAVITASAVRMSSDGARNIPAAIFAVVDLVPNDYIEIWVEGDGTTDNMLVNYANLTVVGDA